MMKFIPVRTRVFCPPKDDLPAFLNEYVPVLSEGDVLFVSSKIVSIGQGRCIRESEVKNFDGMIATEVERYLPKVKLPNGREKMITINNGTFAHAGGTDLSNGNGYYILPLKNPDHEAKKIRDFFRKKYLIKDLGVVITDNQSIPLRFGSLGFSVGFAGFEPLRDYRGEKDIFGKELVSSRVNLVDSISAMAVLSMGEGEEQKPIVVLRGADFLRFKEEWSEIVIKTDEDDFSPMYKDFKKGGKIGK